MPQIKLENDCSCYLTQKRFCIILILTSALHDSAESFEKRRGREYNQYDTVSSARQSLQPDHQQQELSGGWDYDD
jgi:hypothetical protein